MQRRLLRFLTVMALAICLAPPASAITYEGVTLPDTMAVDGQTLVLNGIGLRTLTVFSVRIYVAGLYLPKQSHDAQQIMASPEPKAIVLEFLHAGSKADVEKEYREGERVNCAGGGCSQADAPDFERLVAAAPGVAPGDTTTYLFARGGVEVLANGKPIGKFANADLARLLLAGFIGDHPPSQALKAGLLGLPPS